MLRKESVEWSQEHHSLIEGQSQNPPPTLHYKVRDANECEFWISPANNTVSRSNPQNARPSCDTVRGGLLLEEMGLGKI